MTSLYSNPVNGNVPSGWRLFGGTSTSASPATTSTSTSASPATTSTSTSATSSAATGQDTSGLQSLIQAVSAQQGFAVPQGQAPVTAPATAPGQNPNIVKSLPAGGLNQALQGKQQQ